MEVDWAGPDVTTARDGNTGVPKAGEQGTQNMKRGPHFADQIVRSFRPENVGSVYGQRVVVDPPGRSAKGAQQFHHSEGITDPGNVTESNNAFGKNRSGHDCEGGVFASTGTYAPFQSLAALNIYPVQKVDSFCLWFILSCDV